MLLPLLRPLATCHAAHLYPLVDRRSGEVDIEAGSIGEATFKHLLYNLNDVRSARLEVSLRRMIIKRKSHRRNGLHTPLDDDTHGARVVHVDPRIVAMIDAPHDEIGLAVGEEFVQCHFDAVDRRTRALVDSQMLAFPHEAIVHWFLGGNGTSHSRAATFRCHHNHVSEGREQLGYKVDTACLVTVVVGDEYQRSFVVHKH